MALGPTSPAGPSPKPDASHDATLVLVATKQFSKQLAHGVHSAGSAIAVLQLDPLARAHAVPLRDVPKLRARISATTRMGGALQSDRLAVVQGPEGSQPLGFNKDHSQFWFVGRSDRYIAWE